jgi:hypothetical protein
MQLQPIWWLQFVIRATLQSHLQLRPKIHHQDWASQVVRAESKNTLISSASTKECEHMWEVVREGCH